MASTLTRRNAEISLRRWRSAPPTISRAETTAEVTTSETFRRELVEKIRALGLRRKAVPAQMLEAAPDGSPAVMRPMVVPADEPMPAVSLEHAPAVKAMKRSSSLRLSRRFRHAILLIGASTGGPQALNAVVSKLNRVIDDARCLIVQHMPPTFTTIFAEHLSRASGRVAHEGVDGEPVRAGQIYIAPGGKHMRVDRRGGEATIAIFDGPMSTSASLRSIRLFSSAAEVWAPSAWRSCSPAWVATGPTGRPSWSPPAAR